MSRIEELTCLSGDNSNYIYFSVLWLSEMRDGKHCRVTWLYVLYHVNVLGTWDSIKQLNSTQNIKSALRDYLISLPWGRDAGEE